MIKRIVWAVFLTFGALAVMSTPSFADTIGPGNCGTCLGNSYTLTMTNEVVGATTTSFDLTLVIGSSGFNGFGAGNVGDVLGVAPKVTSNSSDIVGTPTLLVAPDGSGGSNAGDWTTTVGGLSAATCSSGTQGFICSQANFTGVNAETDADTGGTLTWEWAVTVKNGTLLTGNLASSIKAQFGCEDNAGENCTPQPLTSEDITLQPGGGGGSPPPVPEPASLMLLGSGLLALSSKRIFRKA